MGVRVIEEEQEEGSSPPLMVEDDGEFDRELSPLSFGDDNFSICWVWIHCSWLVLFVCLDVDDEEEEEEEDGAISLLLVEDDNDKFGRSELSFLFPSVLH